MAQAKKSMTNKKPIKKISVSEIAMDEGLTRIQQGKHHDPFDVLGIHTLKNSKKGEQSYIRSFLPQADVVELKGIGEMKRIPNSDLFEYKLSPKEAESVDDHYTLKWQQKNSEQWHETISAYSFKPQIGGRWTYIFLLKEIIIMRINFLVLIYKSLMV